MGVKEKIMDITTIIIGLLIVLLIGYTAFFAYDLIKHKDEFEEIPPGGRPALSGLW